MQISTSHTETMITIIGTEPVGAWNQAAELACGTTNPIAAKIVAAFVSKWAGVWLTYKTWLDLINPDKTATVAQQTALLEKLVCESHEASRMKESERIEAIYKMAAEAVGSSKAVALLINGLKAVGVPNMCYYGGWGDVIEQRRDQGIIKAAIQIEKSTNPNADVSRWDDLWADLWADLDRRRQDYFAKKKAEIEREEDRQREASVTLRADLKTTADILAWTAEQCGLNALIGNVGKNGSLQDVPSKSDLSDQEECALVLAMALGMVARTGHKSDVILLTKMGEAFYERMKREAEEAERKNTTK